LNDPHLKEAVESAQADANEDLRKESLKFQSQLRPSGALGELASALQRGSLGEKQAALGALGSLDSKGADALLLDWTTKLVNGQVPAELQVDVLEAAGKRENPEIKAKLEAYQAALAKKDPLAPFRVSLFGGNAADGKKIFFERVDAACVRCHKIAGQGSEGGEVGPELTHVASRRDRDYILESIAFPNKQIAQGFESLLVTTKDGTSFAGIVKSETDSELVLNSPEDGIVKIKKSDITRREKGLSSMPEGLAVLLGPRDLRDVVEFLSTCK
jgi:quinoprotein glucose dehydrogenase